MNEHDVAFFAGFTPEFDRQTSFRCHGNLSGGCHILSSYLWVCFAEFLGLLKEDLNSLPCYQFNVGLLHRFYQNHAKEVEFT